MQKNKSVAVCFLCSNIRVAVKATNKKRINNICRKCEYCYEK